MKFFNLLALAFVTLLSITASAVVTLDDGLRNCFVPAVRQNTACKIKNECSKSETNKQLTACVNEMRLKPASCEGLKCVTPVADSVFPQSRGCRFTAESNANGLIKAFLDKNPSSKLPCIVGNYAPSEKSWPVEIAVQQKDKAWRIELAKLPVSFEKAIPSKIIIPLTTEQMKYAISRIDMSFSCDGSHSQDDDYQGDLQMNAHLCPARHYTGRGGSQNFEIVSKFSINEAVQICGVKLPAGTHLSFRIDSGRREDGSVALYGLPKELFPPSVMSGQKIDGEFMCLPGPKLDWQHCNCFPAITEHEYDAQE